MKNNIYYIFICMFSLIITAPFWGIGIPNDNENNEKRNLVNIKDIKNLYSLKEFITDNHGFRNILSNSCISFYLNIFNESPIPDLVELGQNDFLFLGKAHNNTYNASLGIAKFEEEDILYAYNNILDIQEFCENLGIDFYLIIAPNKASIYPEHLKLKPNDTPRLKDKLINKLKQTDLNFMDLTSFMTEQKQQGVLYYKYDSHWNNYGALLATKEVLKNIGKRHDLKQIDENDYIIEQQLNDSGFDLSMMLNISVPDNNYYDVKLKTPMTIKDTLLKDNIKEAQLSFAINKSNNNGINAFIIRDSFFSAMYTPFMNSIESASIFRIMNIHVKIKKKDILEEIVRVGKPNFILYEVVERNVNLIGIQ